MVSDIIFNIFFLIFSIFVSLIFWLKDSNKGYLRFFISMHSILILITLVGVMHIGLGLHIYHNTMIGFLFVFLLILSTTSIIASFEYFKGSRWFHLLHLWNLFALLLTAFIGTMSLTNDWL
jgi:hypothetical protein